jgi:hypothetical protein
MKNPPRPRLPKDADGDFMVFEFDRKTMRIIEDEITARGVSAEHVMWEVCALLYQKHGVPLPPELRSYLTENVDYIPSDLRAKILKPDLH